MARRPVDTTRHGAEFPVPEFVRTVLDRFFPVRAQKSLDIVDDAVRQRGFHNAILQGGAGVAFVDEPLRGEVETSEMVSSALYRSARSMTKDVAEPVWTNPSPGLAPRPMMTAWQMP